MSDLALEFVILVALLCAWAAIAAVLSQVIPMLIAVAIGLIATLAGGTHLARRR